MMKNTSSSSKIKMASLSTIIGFMVLGYTAQASAFEYRTDKPMAFTYQKGSDNWFGCGPIQCLLAAEDSKQIVFDRVTSNSHGHFRRIGTYGRCTIYQSDGQLDSWDNDPKDILDYVERDC